MAFSLRGFKAYGVRTSGATRQHVAQVAELSIVAANTDTALDLSSVTAGALGTFWTDTTGDSTYGSLATQALGAVRNIQSAAVDLKAADSEQLSTRQQVAGDGIVSFLSAASAGGGVAETYTVTGLLATDTIVAVTQAVKGANVRSEIKKFLSNASAGGAAAEVYVVTGLLATDTILSVTAQVASATGRAAISTLSGTVAAGAATGNAVVTGLLGTDTILSVTQSTKGANSLPLLGYGAPAANAIPFVYSADPGANGVLKVLFSRAATTDTYVPVSWTTLADNALTVTYGADPGAGAKVLVTVARNTTDYVTPLAYGSPGAGTLAVTYGYDPGAGAKVRVLVNRATGTLALVAGQFGYAVTTHLPAITFVSGDAPTAHKLKLSWTINDGTEPVTADYGAAF